MESGLLSYIPDSASRNLKSRSGNIWQHSRSGKCPVGEGVLDPDSTSIEIQNFMNRVISEVRVATFDTYALHERRSAVDIDMVREHIYRWPAAKFMFTVVQSLRN